MYMAPLQRLYAYIQLVPERWVTTASRPFVSGDCSSRANNFFRLCVVPLGLSFSYQTCLNCHIFTSSTDRFSRWGTLNMKVISAMPHERACVRAAASVRLYVSAFVMYTCVYEGVGIQITNVSRIAVMDVISFLCVSLGSSTVQLHDSLGSRRACACSAAGFSSQRSDRA
jgi:hypothetical protein